MNKQRKTSHILNVFQYDADGHVVLPASLTLGIAPAGNDNSGKVGTTAWVRTYVSGLSYQGAITLTVTGTSGAATLVGNTLNIPTYTLAGLGGQAALSGTGFVKISGTTISYDNNTYATQTYVGTAIANLVDSSPATLDTLNELAAALGDDPNFATTVATSIGTKQAQLNGTGFVKVTGTTVSYDNSTYLTTGTAGTTYVPYTGATGDVNLGVYNLAGGNININGSGSSGGALRLKQYGSSEANLEGYNSISTLTSGVFYFTSSASVPNFKNFALNPSGLTDNTLRTYALPDASGTIALTSNIPTVSGTSGYISKFTGSSTIGNSLIYDTGSVVLIGATTASDGQSKLELINNGPVGLKIKSSAGNGNNTFLSIESSKEWRFVTNRGDLISGNQGDLIIRNNTDSINHIILNESGATTFYGTLTGTVANFSGSVSGTSGNFNGNVRAVDTYNLYKSGNTTLGGQLSYDSIINQLYLWNNVSTGFFSIYTNSTERLNIGSDGTSTFKGPGIVVNRPTASSGEPFLNFSKDGVSRASIYGADGTAGLRFFSDVNTFIVNASSTITLASAGTDASIIRAGAGDELYLGGNNTWQMRMSGGNILMDNGGNVSIGTSTIGYKLFVSTTGTGAFNLNSANSTVGGPMIDFYDTGRSQETVITSTDNTTTGTYIASYSNHPIMFGANAGVSPTAKMVIATNGKVGIGESVPDNTYQGLTIKGSDPSLRLKTTGGSGWTWIEFVNSSGTNNFSMGVNQTSPYFGIKAGAGMDSVHFTMNTSGNMGMGEGANAIARLNVNGSTKINRSFYNWYQGYWTGNGTYWHMKTNMSAGLGGNIQYTMSLFKGYMYSYEGSVREGSIGFHNWDGAMYNVAFSGNLFTTVYRSSDNFVVLVVPSAGGETGVTIDWHQAYAYPFVNAQVTAAGLHGATTGKY